MADCFYLHSGIKKINYDDLPCGDVDQLGHNVTCCVRGSTCLSNGLCQNAGGNGHYSADCTDPTLEDPACQVRCEFADIGILGTGGLAGSQVTYNSTTKLWAYCSYNGGEPDCSIATNEVFPAPAPSSLTTIMVLPTTGAATYSTPSATATTPLVTITTTPSPSSSSSGISSGAATGIGIGAGAGIILVASAIAFVCFKRRRHSNTKSLNSAGNVSSQQALVGELGNETMIGELDGGRTMYELASTSRLKP
ncbi:uncharacterized protein N7473_007192 [Penicillium subrubescens]|uniref:uncharacterized protein n=1 Tax=Penicillium subrubescens TaxID=1316194 RepID=UPI002544FDCA|nr:uncharacterized protein N7473_007192 [Penicillium subrubescens]KAJ5890964.1 hypothetical protein N7473_007192 [Penicillium subrubescens]